MIKSLASRHNRLQNRISFNQLKVESLEGREVPASGLGVASDYSAFILHNFNGYYSDIQGRLAVGGDATITGYSVGTNLTDSDGTRDDVVVGGNLSYTNGQVFNGNIVHGGTGHFQWLGTPNGTIRQGTPIDFNAAKNELFGLSDSYSKLATNGTVRNQWGIVTLTGTNAKLNVFNLKASDLWNANTVTIKAPAGATVLVNVSGAEARMQYLGMTVQGTVAEKVLFNFHQATKVTLQGIGFQGSVLAPKAHVEFSNGNLEGTLVACSWNGYGEIHYRAPDLEMPCNCASSKITGNVWHDKDNDAVIDSNENGLANVCVTLSGYDKDGKYVKITVRTDDCGQYVFDKLKAGKYMIRVHTPTSFKAGKGTTGAFGGQLHNNFICNINVPDCKETGGYNFGQICY